jgi:hypothetical protein
MSIRSYVIATQVRDGVTGLPIAPAAGTVLTADGAGSAAWLSPAGGSPIGERFSTFASVVKNAGVPGVISYTASSIGSPVIPPLAQGAVVIYDISMLLSGTDTFNVAFRATASALHTVQVPVVAAVDEFVNIVCRLAIRNTTVESTVKVFHNNTVSTTMATSATLDRTISNNFDVLGTWQVPISDGAATVKHFSLTTQFASA